MVGDVPLGCNLVLEVCCWSPPAPARQQVKICGCFLRCVEQACIIHTYITLEYRLTASSNRKCLSTDPEYALDTTCLYYGELRIFSWHRHQHPVAFNSHTTCTEVLHSDMVWRKWNCVIRKQFMCSALNSLIYVILLSSPVNQRHPHRPEGCIVYSVPITNKFRGINNGIQVV
jgi:hypothetical protein